MNHLIIRGCSVRAPDNAVKWTTRKKIKWLEGTENITLLASLLARLLVMSARHYSLPLFFCYAPFRSTFFFSSLIFLNLVFWSYFFGIFFLFSSPYFRLCFFVFFLSLNPHETTLIKLISPMLLFALAPIHSTLPMSVPFFLTRFSILPWSSRHPVPLKR
jgi:hypothetical protein